MRRFEVYLPSIIYGLLLACTASLHLSFAEEGPVTLESVEVKPTDEGAVIELKADRPFAFVTYTLADPLRLIVDPAEKNLVSSLPESTPLDGWLITGWRMVGTDFLEFELAYPSEHLVESTDHKLVLRVRPKDRSLVPPPVRPESVPPFVLSEAEGRVEGSQVEGRTVDERPSEPAPPLLPAQPLAPSSLPVSVIPETGPWTLDGVLEFGLSRHRPVQIAREEVNLAQMKLREARRALYPAATLKGSWTEGTASGVNFSEASTGVQFEQPLYYSGRLRETYRQALVNLQVAEKRQTKVKADFSQEIAQAYFQYIGAKAALSGQEGLLGQTEEFLKKVQARYDKGLLTRLEFLNVEAQVNQVKFQRTTAENDLVLARIKFYQRLALSSEAQMEVPSEFPPYSPTPISLEEAMALAAQYRPDIQVNSLLVEFHEFEERIAKAKGRLKVDISGFIGASGSAFETESLNMGDDYFVGIKATQAWGPHGATLSSTTTKTSPKLGQTTRTESTVTSGELGILNQLPGLSEIQQAHIGLEKARNDLEETKASVFQEVQEGVISVTKARIQWEYAQQKIAFRQEQVKILQAQAALNEMLPSQVLEAMIKLTDEKVASTQALTNLQVALAKLNKAVGLPGKYR